MLLTPLLELASSKTRCALCRLCGLMMGVAVGAMLEAVVMLVGAMLEAVVTLVEPTLVEPTLVEPTLVEPTLVEPTLVEPTLVEPTLVILGGCLQRKLGKASWVLLTLLPQWTLWVLCLQRKLGKVNWVLLPPRMTYRDQPQPRSMLLWRRPLKHRKPLGLASVQLSGLGFR
jgi:hypothetical protein